MFSALLTGAALHPVDLVQKGFTGLAEVLADAQISVYHSVPTVFRQFDRSLPEGERFPSVSRVVLGGEEVLGSDFEAFHRRFGSDAVLVNLAGQAESSINSLGFTPWNAEAARNRVSLGCPVEDTDLILLGPDGRPTELYGEIGVRSRYVALGYWQEPERTAEVFLPSSANDDARTYRSGDLARALPDGTLEFAGRVDLQTKIAGVRIEPQEIEAHLRRHEGIRDCAVAVRQDSAAERRLVGYLVASERAARAPDEELRGHLRQHLPAYMIPDAFVWLDRLPLTSSNKVDRRALRAPAADTPAVRTPPRDDVERRLAALWEDVLERQPIGIHDEFFELGGHSLLAVRLFDRIDREFGLRMPLSLLLTGATVEHVATAIRAGHDLPRDDVIPVQPRGRRRPLFVVAGTGSQNLYLRNLANRLGRDQPMYALHQPPANRSVPELARNYLIGLRRIQPKGPYDLVGYSFGGVVAFEIAQQLLAGGDRVGVLALIDSAYPDPSARPARSGARALLRLALKRMWTLRRLGLRTVAASLFAFLRIARARVGRDSSDACCLTTPRAGPRCQRSPRCVGPVRRSRIRRLPPGAVPGAAHLLLGGGKSARCRRHEAPLERGRPRGFRPSASPGDALDCLRGTVRGIHGQRAERRSRPSANRHGSAWCRRLSVRLRLLVRPRCSRATGDRPRHKCGSVRKTSTFGSCTRTSRITSPR